MTAASWPLAWRLARRELRNGLKGFYIFLACLALGVAAITAVQTLSRGILNGLEADGRGLLGGDVAVRQLYRPFDPDQMAYLERAGRVSRSAELRTMVRTPDDGTSSLAELKAVDDSYPLFGTMVLENGGTLAQALALRDGVHGAVVEAGLLDRLGLKTGDSIMVGAARFIIRDVIAREPDRLGNGGFSLGPRLLMTLDGLKATGLEQPGTLIYWNARLALHPGVDPADWRQATENAYREAGWQVRDLNNASPRIGRFVERLGQFLTLVGLTALLVGGVGVSNAVRSHLEARTRTIATLKCLGAPSALVHRIYLLQIMVLAAGGILFGLLAGVALPWAGVSLLADLLPAQARIGIDGQVLALAALFGTLTALAFSLWPLGRVGQVSPAALFRQILVPIHKAPPLASMLASLSAGLALSILAILSADNRLFALWFILGAILTFALFRLAAKMVEAGAARVPMAWRRWPAWRLALANLHRPGNATTAVILSLGLGLTVLSAIALVEGNFTRRVTEALPKTAPSFFFVDVQRDEFDAFKTLVTGFPGSSDFQAVPSLRGRIATINGRPAEQVLVNPEFAWVLNGDRGISYADSPPSDAPIVAGKWWDPGYRGPPLLSISEDVARAFAIGPGDRLAVNVLGRTIEATVASIRHIDFSTMALNFILVFSPGLLDHAPHSWVAAVHAAPDQEAALQKAVVKAWPGVTTIRLKEALQSAAKMLTDIATAARAVTGVALVAGALVLAGTVAAGHRRRVYDAVVLKVLGATRRDVMTAYMLEYGLLGLVAALLAAALGTLTAWAVVTQVMGFSWFFLPQALAATLIVALAVTLVLGLIGAWRALGVPAAPLLRNE